MINSSRKKNIYGAALLLSTIVLVFVATFIIIFAANHGRTLQKLSSNQTRNNQAFTAAEAGMEFGINYFKQNSATILASPTSGFINPFSNSSVTNVTLANNAKYSIVYTNPIANNYTLIQITSTGTSDDGTATRVISQRIAFGSMLNNPPTTSLTSKGNVTLGGSSEVRNTINNNTILTGGSVTISGSARTTVGSGTGSTAGNVRSDIQQNNADLNNMSQSDYFASYFGAPMATIKQNVTYYFNNSTNTNYTASFANVGGSSVWVDQTSGKATVNGTGTIGSPTNPVLLIINGDFDLAGSVTIYGLVFVIGTATTDVLGSSTIIGGLITTSDFNMKGSSDLIYDPSVLSTLKNQTNISYYAKVPGSWRDY